MLSLEDLFLRDVPLYPYLKPAEIVSVACLNRKYRDAINGADKMWKRLSRDVFQFKNKLPAKTWKETFAHAWAQDLRLRKENEEILRANGGEPPMPWGGCQPPMPAPDCPARELPVVQDPYQPIQGFLVHPNSSSIPVVQFAEHLTEIDAMPNFLSFMGSFHQIKPDLAANALVRYKCFMYLHKLYPDSLFVPTMDIEFVWRSHCIRPSLYKQDCQVNSGKIISHFVKPSVALRELRKEALQLTTSLWKTHFQSDYVKDFRPSSHRNFNEELEVSTWYVESLMWNEAPKEEKLEVQISLTQKEILDDWEWFRHVRETVDRNPLYKGLKLWPSLLKSYERYLFMYLITPHERLANPTLLIDFAWHTHMLDPEAYIADMKRILGHELDHDPTVKQDNSRVVATSKVWEQEFGVSYEQEHQVVRHLTGETVHQEYHFGGFHMPPMFNPVCSKYFG